MVKLKRVRSRKPRDSQENANFNALKEIGFELESPQDGFSFQPDSGSRTGGEIGEQEYGIVTDPDAEGFNAEKNKPSTKQNSVEIPNSVVPGESQWSQDQRQSEDERLSGISQETDAELEDILMNLIQQLASLKNSEIELEVNGGDVYVNGYVESEQAKFAIEQVLRSYPEVIAIHNKIEIIPNSGKQSEL